MCRRSDRTLFRRSAGSTGFSGGHRSADAIAPAVRIASTHRRRSPRAGRPPSIVSASQPFPRRAVLCSPPGCRPDRIRSGVSWLFRHREFQHGDWAGGSKPAYSQCRRQQHHCPFLHDEVVAFEFDRAAAIDTHQNSWHAGLTDIERHSTPHALHSEMRAINKLFARDWRFCFNYWRHRLDRAQCEIDAGERLLDLQGTREAGRGVDVIPVVETKGNVAVFLNLEYDDFTADRVNSTGFYQHTLAAGRRETRQIIVRCPLRDRAQIGGGRSRFQARVNAASWSRLKNDPRLGLAGVAIRDQLSFAVGRVDLHGEHLLHIEEFQQQRKSAKPGRQSAEDLSRRLFHQLRDGAPFQWSVRDTAGVLVAIAQQPRLTDRSVTRQRRVEPVLQSPSAPKTILVDWVEV